MHRIWLNLLVFVSGFVMLGIELAGARLLAPFFGSSLLVWANLIGIILFAIALGNYLGGRLADIRPNATLLWQIFALAGFSTALLPLVGRPILAMAIPALVTFDAISGAASFLGILVLFIIPMTCLGMTAPFAIRLAVHERDSLGSNAGGLYALSTAGSLLGVYITVFLLIPVIGTQSTFLSFGILVLAITILHFLLQHQFKIAIMNAGLLLMGLVPGLLFAKSTLKDQPGLITEIESPYNYIQVFDRNGVRSVAVNEGQAQQSIYRPDGHLSGGIWDLFLLAPQFMAKPKSPKNLLIIGLAAGTVAKEYSRIFVPLSIDGVEIDQTMVDVGQKYMSMTEPNLRVIVMDGRAFLSQTKTRYDIIVLDAYHQPYIPFHLATVEFFGLVREHLTPHGVVALNAARTLTDFRLVNSLATTMHQVFPTVIALDHPVDANSLLIAPNDQFAVDEFRFTRTGDGELDALMSDIHPRLATVPGVLLTDDRAPVENLIHEIILDFVVQR